jgi:hypothetical protein
MTAPAPKDLDQWFEFNLLLAHMERRTVVPVVGSELLVVRADGEDVHLYDWVARRLGERLRIPRMALHRGFTLNDLVEVWVQESGRRREQLYTLVYQLVSEAELEPPAAIRALADIEAFPLYVTTTFDDLLYRALLGGRRPDRARTEARAFSPWRFDDLDPGWDPARAAGPLVYHLFGRAGVEPEYTLCDEDVLEFLVALNTTHESPKRVFDVVRSSNLLFIGCAFPDWLSRFFLRTLKRTKLSSQRRELEVVADTVVVADERLGAFLRRFSYQTYLYPGDAAGFVHELAARWAERRARAPRPTTGQAPRATDRPAPPAGSAGDAVFLSYASEDRDAAVRLRTALSDAGVDVWFDEARLETGHAYDEMIQESIRNCALFIALVSNNTEARDDGYFRKEWRFAEARSWNLSTRRRFIIPVRIDRLSPEDADVPASFKSLTWGYAPRGQPDDALIDEIVDTLRSARRSARGGGGPHAG